MHEKTFLRLQACLIFTLKTIGEDMLVAFHAGPLVRLPVVLHFDWSVLFLAFR